MDPLIYADRMAEQLARADQVELRHREIPGTTALQARDMRNAYIYGAYTTLMNEFKAEAAKIDHEMTQDRLNQEIADREACEAANS